MDHRPEPAHPRRPRRRPRSRAVPRPARRAHRRRHRPVARRPRRPAVHHRPLGRPRPRRAGRPADRRARRRSGSRAHRSGRRVRRGHLRHRLVPAVARRVAGGLRHLHRRRRAVDAPGARRRVRATPARHAAPHPGGVGRVAPRRHRLRLHALPGPGRGRRRGGGLPPDRVVAPPGRRRPPPTRRASPTCRTRRRGPRSRCRRTAAGSSSTSRRGGAAPTCSCSTAAPIGGPRSSKESRATTWFRVDVDRDRLVGATTLDAPKGRLVAARLGDPTPEHWVDLVPEGDDVLTELRPHRRAPRRAAHARGRVVAPPPRAVRAARWTEITTVTGGLAAVTGLASHHTRPTWSRSPTRRSPGPTRSRPGDPAPSPSSSRRCRDRPSIRPP